MHVGDVVTLFCSVTLTKFNSMPIFIVNRTKAKSIVHFKNDTYAVVKYESKVNLSDNGKPIECFADHEQDDRFLRDYVYLHVEREFNFYITF